MFASRRNMRRSISKGRRSFRSAGFGAPRCLSIQAATSSSCARWAGGGGRPVKNSEQKYPRTRRSIISKAGFSPGSGRDFQSQGSKGRSARRLLQSGWPPRDGAACSAGGLQGRRDPANLNPRGEREQAVPAATVSLLPTHPLADAVSFACVLLTNSPRRV